MFWRRKKFEVELEYKTNKHTILNTIHVHKSKNLETIMKKYVKKTYAMNKALAPDMVVVVKGIKELQGEEKQNE
jgi:hypothetical protein